MRKTPSLIKQIMEKSKKDPWYVKLKRRIRLKLFIFKCSIKQWWWK